MIARAIVGIPCVDTQWLSHETICQHVTTYLHDNPRKSSFQGSQLIVFVLPINKNLDTIFMARIFQDVLTIVVYKQAQ